MWKCDATVPRLTHAKKNSPYLFLKKYGLFDQKVRSFCAKGTVYFCTVKGLFITPY